ncbi:unnamed protein product [Lota lota]
MALFCAPLAQSAVRATARSCSCRWPAVPVAHCGSVRRSAGSGARPFRCVSCWSRGTGLGTAPEGLARQGRAVRHRWPQVECRGYGNQEGPKSDKEGPWSGPAGGRAEGSLPPPAAGDGGGNAHGRIRSYWSPQQGHWKRNTPAATVGWEQEHVSRIAGPTEARGPQFLCDKDPLGERKT